MKRLYLGMVMVLLAMTWLFSGCSPDNNPSPVERIDLDLTLAINEWSDHEVRKAALIVHDANGAALDYRVFEQPEDETYSISFKNVPASGYVTVLSNRFLHLTWPVENDYDDTVLATYPISVVQNYGGRFIASYYSAYLERPRGFLTTHLRLQGSCPENALHLTAEAHAPYGNFWYASANPCANGNVDARFWTPLQDNGKASLILWPAGEHHWDYIEPLSYLALIDKNPDETYTFTADDFMDDVQTAQVTVNGAPEGAWIRYSITAMKAGVPLFGFSPILSSSANNTASVRFANVLNSVDEVIQSVLVSHNDGLTTRFKAIDAAAFNPNDSWSLSAFFSIPDASGLSLQQNSRLNVYANGFGSGNVWASYRVNTISGGDNPKYIYWLAYDQPGSTLSDLQFTYPELPEALATYNPDIAMDYVSVRVSGADYNLLDNAFRDQGRYRSASRRIRDNLTSTDAQTLEVNEPEIRFYPHERVGW